MYTNAFVTEHGVSNFLFGIAGYHFKINWEKKSVGEK